MPFSSILDASREIAPTPAVRAYLEGFDLGSHGHFADAANDYPAHLARQFRRGYEAGWLAQERFDGIDSHAGQSLDDLAVASLVRDTGSRD